MVNAVPEGQVLHTGLRLQVGLLLFPDVFLEAIALRVKIADATGEVSFGVGYKVLGQPFCAELMELRPLGIVECAVGMQFVNMDVEEQADHQVEVAIRLLVALGFALPLNEARVLLV